MKQRLGLALALLHDPELLILDEPTNGLDPNGISEMRDVLNSLNAEGKTIMLSSHLLSEIEKIASHVGILNQGSLMYEGTIDGLKTLEAARPKVEIIASNHDWIMNTYGDKVEQMDHDVLQIQVEHKSDIPQLIKSIVEGGCDIYQVTQVQSSLEQLFMSITHEQNNS